MSNPSGRFAIVHFINVVHIGAKPYDTLRNSDFVIHHSDLFVQFFDRKTGDELANTPITNCSSWRHMTIAEVDSDDAERAALMGMQSLKLELVSQKEAIDNLVLADALNSKAVKNTGKKKVKAS